MGQNGTWLMVLKTPPKNLWKTQYLCFFPEIMNQLLKMIIHVGTTFFLEENKVVPVDFTAERK